MSQLRIRTLKPEMWSSRDFRSLSDLGRLCFIALISHADDHGRLKTDPQHVAETMLMGNLPTDIDQQLRQMEARGMVMRYGPDRMFLSLQNWFKHQHVDKPKDSAIPAPPKFKRGDRRNKQQLELAGVANDREGSRPTRARRIGSDQEPIGSDQLVRVDEAMVALAIGDAQTLVATLGAHLNEWQAKAVSSPRRDLEEADRLLRVDKRPMDEVLLVLDWACHDDFWRPNIRSLAKFRRQYDTLRGQMQRRGAPPREHPLDRWVGEVMGGDRGPQ